jgi:glycosyltransferase involved in cell wall biosynthesis
MKAMLVGPRSTKELTYGMSIGFDLLISGFAERNLPHIIIDRSQGMVGRTVGIFTFGGVLATLRMLYSFTINLRPAAVVYLTIGTSKAGFVRDMLMIWLGWLFQKRLVLHLKGGGFLCFYKESSRWLRFLMRQTFSKVDTFIVLGDLLRDQFGFVSDIDSKLVVVPNGLPTELQDNNQKPRVWGEVAPFRLLYLSNMIPSKGYLDVLEACRILSVERGIPIQCDFCGAFLATVNDNVEISPAEAETAFQRLVDETGLASVVRYHGTVRGHQKREILRAANVFILPTVYPWEGQPISIIEALAYGLPVIATRYRGIPEQVIDGWNGYLLPEKLPQAIADAVEKLWRDPALYEQFSQNAIQHYRQNFTREAHLNRLIPVILGQHG